MAGSPQLHQALVGRTLGLRRLCSSCATPGRAGETARRSGWRCAAGGLGQQMSLESASRAARRARRAHSRAFARDPNAYWNGDWDSPPAEAFGGGIDSDDVDEDNGRLESQDVWAEWLNRVSEPSLHAEPRAALTQRDTSCCSGARRRMALLSHCAQPKALACRALARCNSLRTSGLTHC